MQPQNKEPSCDEQLLYGALRMNHEMAHGIVFESLSTGRERTDEKLAFAHVYSCIDIRCGEFWLEMMADYPDEESQRKLLEHTSLNKFMEEAWDRIGIGFIMPRHTFDPLWEQRN